VGDEFTLGNIDIQAPVMTNVHYVYNWFVSYFSGHSQSTQYDNLTSAFQEISAGIIQLFVLVQPVLSLTPET